MEEALGVAADRCRRVVFHRVRLCLHTTIPPQPLQVLWSTPLEQEQAKSLNMSVETLKNTTVSALLSACRLTVPDYSHDLYGRATGSGIQGIERRGIRSLGESFQGFSYSAWRRGVGRSGSGPDRSDDCECEKGRSIGVHRAASDLQGECFGKC